MWNTMAEVVDLPEVPPTAMVRFSLEMGGKQLRAFHHRDAHLTGFLQLYIGLLNGGGNDQAIHIGGHARRILEEAVDAQLLQLQLNGHLVTLSEQTVAARYIFTLTFQILGDGAHASSGDAYKKEMLELLI
jgi:hypothetical protein